MTTLEGSQNVRILNLGRGEFSQLCLLPEKRKKSPVFLFLEWVDGKGRRSSDGGNTNKHQVLREGEGAFTFS